MENCPYVPERKCQIPQNCDKCLKGMQIMATVKQARSIDMFTDAFQILAAEMMEARAWKECKKAMEEGRT